MTDTSNGAYFQHLHGMDLRRVQRRLLASLLRQPGLVPTVLTSGIRQEDFPEEWHSAFAIATKEPGRGRQIVDDPGGDLTIKHLCAHFMDLKHGHALQLADQIVASVRRRDALPDGDELAGEPEHQRGDVRLDAPIGLNADDDRTNDAEGPEMGTAGQEVNGSNRKHRHEAAHSWEHPDWSILDDRRGELPDFPLDTLSAPWQGWVERAAHGAGVTPGHVVVPLLGVGSSLIGTSRRVRASRSWSEPMTLWTSLVAASGDRKTPSLRITLRALDLIEKNNSTAISQTRLAHETRIQNAKEVIKKWKEERQAALDAEPRRDPPPMPTDAIDPGSFVIPRLYATDPTIESLAFLLQVRPRGMTLIRDELSGLFSNMGRYSGGSDRPFWLEAWNGNRHVVERVSRSIVVDHLLVGVVGGFQPDKLARAFAGDEDGMYGRFLYGWPLPPDYRPLTNDASEVEPDLYNALSALARLPSEDADGNFVPQDIWLSQDAVVKFEEFRRFVDTTKHGLDGRERQWFVKGETQVLRLAGTLALMAWAISLGASSSDGVEGITTALEPQKIAERFMVAAIRIWREFFWPHARAALRQIGLSERHANARRALRWIKANGKDEVSREEIRREALGQSLDADDTQRLLEGLAKAGWLRATAIDTPGRRRHRWEVNPNIHATAESVESAESV